MTTDERDEVVRTYVDASVDTLRDFTGTLGVFVDWESGEPVLVPEGEGLAELVRRTHVGGGVTMGTRFPRMSPEEQAMNYYGEYLAAERNLTDVHGDLEDEAEQLSQTIGSAGVRLDQLSAAVSDAQKLASGSVTGLDARDLQRLLSDVANKVGDARRNVADVRVRQQSWGGMLHNLGTSFGRTLGIGRISPGKWTVRAARPIWVRLMNDHLVTTESRFDVDEIPLSASLTAMRQTPIEILRLGHLQSVESLAAVAELHYMAVERARNIKDVSKAERRPLVPGSEKRLQDAARLLRVVHVVLRESIKIRQESLVQIQDLLMQFVQKVLAMEYLRSVEVASGGNVGAPFVFMDADIDQQRLWFGRLHNMRFGPTKGKWLRDPLADPFYAPLRNAVLDAVLGTRSVWDAPIARG